jgi:hypothetical protein
MLVVNAYEVCTNIYIQGWIYVFGAHHYICITATCDYVISQMSVNTLPWLIDTELVICASIINVCSGGNLLLFTLGCVVCICCLNIVAWMEVCSLFVGHA